MRKPLYSYSICPAPYTIY